MKKALIIAVVLVLNCTLVAFAQFTPSSSINQVVVDRSTQSQALNEYVLLTRDAIQKAWRTPLELAGSSAVKGRVRVNYTITRGGRLEDVKLVEGSGNGEMDRSLMDAIRSAQPFPPFADNINAGRVLIRANFIIADLPTVGITRVSQPASPKQADSLASPNSTRTLLWGRPAGSSKLEQEAEVKPEPSKKAPIAPNKKYRWGAK